MNIKREDKKTKCPKCGSKEILTLGLDQMCCDCDWDNSRWLVDRGQMDQPYLALKQHFVEQTQFEELESQDEIKNMLEVAPPIPQMAGNLSA